MENTEKKRKKETLGIRWSPEAMEWLRRNRLEVEFCAKHGIDIDPATFQDNCFQQIKAQ